jgi:hypothetical protein
MRLHALVEEYPKCLPYSDQWKLETEIRCVEAVSYYVTKLLSSSP